jgi:predicted permease
VLVVNAFMREMDFPAENRADAYRHLMARLRALPGVIGIAEATRPPMSGSFSDTDIKVEGKIVGDTNVNGISPGYFAVMGTAMLAGRDFNERDTPSSPLVAIVSETLAARYLDGRPLGRMIAMPMEPGTPDRVFTVVGLVKDMKYYTMRETFAPLMFLPTSQEKTPALTLRVVMSAVTPVAQLIPAVNAVLNEMAPRSSVRFASMQTYVDESVMQERLMARLAGLFGAVALALAFVGLYGVVAYTVASRRAEIGLRVALGAARVRIVLMMLSDTSRMVALGVAVGTTVALGGAGVLGTLLYGITPRDATTLALAVIVLALAAFVAALVPARRAAAIDPIEVLRE